MARGNLHYSNTLEGGLRRRSYLQKRSDPLNGAESPLSEVPALKGSKQHMKNARSSSDWRPLKDHRRESPLRKAGFVNRDAFSLSGTLALIPKTATREYAWW